MKIERRWGRSRGCGGIGRASHRCADPVHPVRRCKVPLVRPPSAPGSAPPTRAAPEPISLPIAHSNASQAARPHGSGARGLRGPHSAAQLGAPWCLAPCTGPGQSCGRRVPAGISEVRDRDFASPAFGARFRRCGGHVCALDRTKCLAGGWLAFGSGKCGWLRSDAL